MGDSDGHYGNVVVDKNGVVWNIDFDRAISQGLVFRHLNDWTFKNDEDLVEGTVRFAHGRIDKVDRNILNDEEASYYQSVVSKMDNYGWMARTDQLIRLEDIKEQLTRLERLHDARYQEALVKDLAGAGINEENASNMVDALRDRAAVLRKVLTKSDMFGDGPIDLSFVIELLPVRHAAVAPRRNDSWRVAA